MGVRGAKWDLLVWGAVSEVLVFAGETPVSKPSPRVYAAIQGTWVNLCR